MTIKRKYEIKDDKGAITYEEHIVGVPQTDTELFEQDILILLGKVQDVDRFIEINR